MSSCRSVFVCTPKTVRVAICYHNLKLWASPPYRSLLMTTGGENIQSSDATNTWGLCSRARGQGAESCYVPWSTWGSTAIHCLLHSHSLADRRRRRWTSVSRRRRLRKLVGTGVFRGQESNVTLKWIGYVQERSGPTPKRGEAILFVSFQENECFNATSQLGHKDNTTGF
jgi:hypothetical protein